ncbi:hypothetical protein E2C01_037918 [Portunus trituberculatus]|uniref:Uncharacterized protein n=1 Tax=Portunus trituberculatus TaxID=210409 RepID=A0A5B7FG84_PORTR|nr:hypothetical protein [Portunus trituberculatus]
MFQRTREKQKHSPADGIVQEVMTLLSGERREVGRKCDRSGRCSPDVATTTSRFLSHLKVPSSMASQVITAPLAPPHLLPNDFRVSPIDPLPAVSCGAPSTPPPATALRPYILVTTTSRPPCPG